MSTSTTIKVAEIRRALADYMRAEGCSCCRNAEAHDAAAERLAKLLGVPKYDDGSGFNFAQYESGRRVKPARKAKKGRRHNGT